LKDFWGCEGDTRLPNGAAKEIEDGIEYIYRNCPMRFIPPSIWKWWAMVKYYKDFPSAPFPAMDRVSCRFMLAYWYYSGKLIENQREAGNG